MSVRRLIVAIDPSSLNVTEFCRAHGISTWFFYDLRRRYALEGEAALEPKSRAAHVVANRTPDEVEDEIVAKRKELVEAGLDAGPATISFHLRDLCGLPSESTIWRILTSRGFIAADPSKAPKSSGRRFEAERANECWQLDDTGWELADGTPVKIFNVIDDHSRLAVASVAMIIATGAAALAACADAARTLGWPERFLSDNAGAFRYVLAAALAAMGIGAGHSRPYHPQTNGKVERFHQTLKRWLERQPPAATIDELQTQLDMFRLIYNHHRPHRGIDRRFPADVWHHAPKSGPVDYPLGTPKTYRGKVRGGRVQVGHFYDVSVGAAHNGHEVMAVLTNTRCHIFDDGRLIRELTIDPTQASQPLYDGPGRPPRLP